MEHTKKKHIGSGKETRSPHLSRSSLNKNKDIPSYVQEFSKQDFSEDSMIVLPHRKEPAKATFESQKQSCNDTNILNGQSQLRNSVKKNADITGHSESTLDVMAQKILKVVTIIKYENRLYYYTGRAYQSINDGEELLRLVRSKVSHNAFGSNSVKRFSDLFIFLRSDDNLIPSNVEERIWESQYLISFKNGVLDLRREKLLPHSPKHLTFYELDAKWEKSNHAPEFQHFLEKVSRGDHEIIQRILEVIGYLLSPINEGKCFFVMGTAPNSGKSTLGELLKRLLGNDLVSSRATYQISKRFSLGDIHNKLLNMSLDLPNGKLNPVTVAIIKQITGGDTIATEQKYEKIKEVHTNMRFLFGTNFPVTISQEDNDDAFWDRMIIIPFLHSLTKADEDPHILNKMLLEKNSIIYQSLVSFHRVLVNHCTFSYCEAAEQMKNLWRYHRFDSTGSMKKFIACCVSITGDSRDWIYSQDIYNEYIKFCEEQDIPHLPYSDFLTWMCNNLNGCSQKRIHLTGRNPRSGLIGIRYKDENSLKGDNI